MNSQRNKFSDNNNVTYYYFQIRNVIIAQAYLSINVTYVDVIMYDIHYFMVTFHSKI